MQRGVGAPLAGNHAGQGVLQLKTPYRDGTSHLVMSPLEFMQRLAALVPRPRLHLIRFHGVLAPPAKLRAAIVPIPAQTTTAHAADCARASVRIEGRTRTLRRAIFCGKQQGLRESSRG